MGDTNTTNMDVTTSAEGIESEGNKGPTVEELMKELAAEKAMNKKYKTSLDKATGEAADYKRQLNAKMSADEQAQAEALERQRQTEEELNQLRRESALNKASKKFMALSMDESSATKAAEALYDGDTDGLFKILEAHISSVRAGEEQKFLAGRSTITAGNGTAQTISQEQFRKMSYDEMRQLHMDNPTLFEQLTK